MSATEIYELRQVGEMWQVFINGIEIDGTYDTMEEAKDGLIDVLCQLISCLTYKDNGNGDVGCNNLFK